jgi:hypothetical protein
MRLILFLFITVLIVLSSCKKPYWKDNTDIYQVPYTLFFMVKKNNQALPDSVLENMKLAYYQNGVKKYVSDFTRGINEGGFNAHDEGIQATRNIGLISGNENIKLFYLEYPDNTKDSLYVDYRHINFDDAKKHPCRCEYPMQPVKFNNLAASVDSSLLSIQRVYLFQRQ